MNSVRFMGYAIFLGGVAGEILTIALFSNEILGAALFASGFASLTIGIFFFFMHSRHRVSCFRLGIACFLVGSLLDMFYHPNLKSLILDVFCFIIAGTLIALVVEAPAKIQVAVAVLTILLGYLRIGFFISDRGFTSYDEAFMILIFAGIVVINASRLVKPHAKVKKVVEKSATPPVEEEKPVAEPEVVPEAEEEEEAISLKDVPELQPMIAKKKAKAEQIEPEEKHVVDEETEKEVKIYKKSDRCIVCNTTLKGQAYICPTCETRYCLRCAELLIKRQETCWQCKNLLNFEEVQD